MKLLESEESLLFKPFATYRGLGATLDKNSDFGIKKGSWK